MSSRLQRSTLTYSRQRDEDSLSISPIAISHSSQGEASSGVDSDLSQATSSTPTINNRRRSSKKIGGFKTEDYYTTIEVDGEQRHKCKSCDRTYDIKTSTSIKNNHSASHCTEDSVIYHQLPDEIKISLIIQLIVTCALPFRIVENPIFRQISGVNLDRKTLSEKIKEDYEEKQLELMHRLNNIDNIAITTDLWTSTAHRPYSAYTATFFEGGKLKSALLDFIRFPHPHSGSHLCEKMIDTFNLYGIYDKVVSISADGAANNKASINLMNMLREASSLADIQYINCICHILNLVVQDAAQCAVDTINKAREICKIIRISSRMRQNLGTSLLVHLDVKTRWNSTFLMLKRMIEIEDKIRRLAIDEPELQSFALSDDEWIEIREFLVPFYQIFYEATILSSKLNAFNYSYAVICYRKIIDSCTRHFEQQPAQYRLFAKRALDKLKSYQQRVETKHALIATMLDPYANKMLGSDERIELGEELRELVGPIDKADGSPEGSFFHTVEDERDEISWYLDSKPPPKGTDIIEWWKNNQSNYPHLYKLAKKYFIVRPSSVPSESTFSIASWIISPKRTRLSDENIRAILFLHSFYTNKLNSVSLDDEE